MKKVTPQKAQEFANKYLKNWEVVDRGTRLRKRATFSDYNHAIRFLLAIEDKMTEMDHFIDAVIFYDEMLISLHTHDKNTITNKDFKLAVFLDRKLADMDVE
jgi:pterin-4a-carbinolamine dehydratase